jgi:hypothetical protein
VGRLCLVCRSASYQLLLGLLRANPTIYAKKLLCRCRESDQSYGLHLHIRFKGWKLSAYYVLFIHSFFKKQKNALKAKFGMPNVTHYDDVAGTRTFLSCTEVV